MKRNKHGSRSFRNSEATPARAVKGAIAMKVVTIFAVAGMMLAAGAVFAAEENKDTQKAVAAEQPKANGEESIPVDKRRPLRPGVDMAGNWVSRFLVQGENLDKLGIEGDQREKLLAELGEIGDKLKELQKKIDEAGLEQGRLMREAMETPGADMSAVYDKVKEIGAMRTEQSLLATRIFVAMRDNLTKEQHEKVREFVRTEGRQRIEARREFFGNMNRRRPKFDGMPHHGPFPGGMPPPKPGERPPEKPGEKPAEKPAEAPAKE